MFPSSEEIGVVLEKQDVPMVTEIYNTATQAFPSDLPECFQVGRACKLPEADEDGQIALDELTVRKIVRIGSLGLDGVQKKIDAQLLEYEKRNLEVGTYYEDLLGKFIVGELETLLKIKSFVCELETTLDASGRDPANTK